LLTGSMALLSQQLRYYLLWGSYKFADESACLTANNVQNEVVTSHRSQEVLKMLSLYT
jgi:hypothetical protein